MSRFSRRGRKPPTEEDASQAAAAPTDAPRDWAGQLIARLEEVAAQAERPEDALEPALDALLEAVGTQAGALCLFDSRRHLLRLAAERGLSDEGCRWVRTIRRGDPTTWEMPLHGLLNRRAYLIEGADRNRYVPKLVEGAMRTVACVPFYGAWDGLGCVVLVSTGTRPLAERDLVALSRPLEELAKMVEAVRQQVQEADDTPPTRPPVSHYQVDVVALNAERDALRAEREALRAELAEGTDERGELARELAAVTADRDHRQAALDAALAEREALEEELERLRERTERVGGLEGRVAELEAQLERSGSSRTAVEASQSEYLERIGALERSRADLARRADALAGELERARAVTRDAVATAERRVAEQEAEIGRLSRRLEEASAAGQVDRTAGERHDAERTRLANELDAALRREEKLREEAFAATAEHRRVVEAALDATRTAEAARAAVEGELDSSRARLRDATRATDAAAARVATAERERERLAAELAAATSREAELRHALESVDARHAQSRDAELASAIEAARTADHARNLAEQEAAASRARMTSLSDDLARAGARLESLDHEVERLASELRAAAAREQHLREEAVAAEARRLAASSEELTQTREALEAAELARTGFERELAALRTTLAVAEAARAQAVLEAGAASERVARQAREVEVARAESARVASALDEAWRSNEELRARLAADAEELGELRQLRDRLQANDHTRSAEEATLRRQLEHIARERDVLRATLGTAEVERDQVRSELAAAEAARNRLEAALQRETLDRARLAAIVAEGSPSPANEQGGIARLVAAKPAVPATAPAPAARPAPPRVAHLQRAGANDSAGKTIVVLDADPAWESLQLDGRRVVRITPSAEAAGELGALEPERIVVNLACPDAMGSMLAARGTGNAARFWGCLGAAGEARVVPLGMVEVASHPIDPEVLVELLKGYVGRGSRVVTAGADVDGLMSLRQALARSGVGVNMAWDAKQVCDLLPVVRPIAVAVDLDLPRWDGFGIVAALAHIDPIPHALLVGGMEDASKAFGGLLSDARHQNRAVAREQYVKAVLGRSEQPPHLARAAEAAAKTSHRAGHGRRHAVAGS